MTSPLNIREFIDQELPYKISNTQQLGGIEISTLNSGSGKGMRIAWINTGSGLRYKLLLDRAMDIADASYNQYNLCWLSHCGIKSGSDTPSGSDWLDLFSGGLLTTCGLTHIGAAEQDGDTFYPMHGLISQQSAEIVEIKQPDIRKGDLSMSITGLIKETTSFGKHLELKRTFSAVLGEPEIYIHDEITNTGYEPIPHMLLYHCNFGWPLVDEGTFIHWKGNWFSRGTPTDNQIFKVGSDYKHCKVPGEGAYRFNGEACAFIDIEPDENGICTSALVNRKLQLAFVLNFNKKELPWLTNWQHCKKGEYVVGLEPGTNALTGRAAARSKRDLIILQPQESRHYHLNMQILHGEEQIAHYLNQSIKLPE